MITFFPANAVINVKAIMTPTQLLKKSRIEHTRPGICDCANSADADVRHEMSAAKGRENVGTRNEIAKKKGMKRRKFKKISGGPVR